MTAIPPTLLAATRSGRIHGRTLAVFVEIHDWADTVAFRPVKAWCIAERLRMSRSHVARAIAILVQLGFLEAGQREGNAITYRIVARPRSNAA